MVERVAKADSGEQPEAVVTEDEIKEMVKIGAEDGSINKQEREFIENVLQFNDIIVEDVMIHRTEIEAMPISFTLEEAADYAVAHSHSRLPIYGDSLDDIKGIISIKQILNFLESHDEKTKLSDLKLSSPLTVAPTRHINSLFHEFQRRRIHLAIVADERGGTDGLITLEDVLEEIVGDIWDESDEEVQKVEQLDAKTLIAMGDAKVEDIYDSIGVRLDDNMLENLSTVILEKLNRFPRQGETMEFNDAELKIMNMTGKKIVRVRITKKGKGSKKG